MKSALTFGLAASALLSTAGCKSHPQAWGEANAIIVVAVDSLWQQVGDSLVAALEPTIATVREERTFNVTQVSPFDSSFVNLRKFKQVVALGVASDPWVEPITDPSRQAPYLHGKPDVWANDQQVSALVLTPGAAAAEVGALARQLGTQLDSTYRSWATQRMYLSGPDTALRRRLAAEEGYSLLLPEVYEEEDRDSVRVFSNWVEVRGNEVRRTITVASRPGVDTSTSAAAALAWRTAVIGSYMNGQDAQPEDAVRRQVAIGALRAFEVQGIWSTVQEGVPSAGPFITRVVPCPAQDRTFLVDAWLYAPGRGSKYEYMIQLQTLLNTFRCGGTQAETPSQ